MRRFILAGSGICVAVACVAVGLFLSTHPANRASAQGRVIVPNFSLQKPISGANLTEAKAVELIKESGWSPTLFSHGYSAEYGSLAVQTGASAASGQPLSVQRDVWKITITGLSIPRPAGRSGAPVGSAPPPVQTLVFWIDDKDGKVLGADGY